MRQFRVIQQEIDALELQVVAERRWSEPGAEALAQVIRERVNYQEFRITVTEHARLPAARWKIQFPQCGRARLGPWRGQCAKRGAEMASASRSRVFLRVFEPGLNQWLILTSNRHAPRGNRRRQEPTW